MTDSVKLPAPRTSGELSLEEAVVGRRSRRHFRDSPLTDVQVSQILWAAYGYKFPGEGPYSRRGTRTCPSAGALYPLEIYLAAGKVEGIKAGFYHYNPEEHMLDTVWTEDLRETLYEACLQQEMIRRAPAILIYTAVYSRVSPRYGERGIHRYVPMDIGHSAQNVYLQTEAMGLGTCAVGAFNDAAVKKVIRRPPEEEPLYLLPVGYPESSG